MKKNIFTLIIGTIAIALTSCAEPSGPNTKRGAVAGGLLGAATGAVIGHQSGNTLEGAAVGGALGAGAGAMYGNSQDQENRRRYGY